MSRRPESMRRKDICKTCGRFMPIKAEGNCQACHVANKFHYRPEFFLRLAYTRVKQRCTNPNNNNYSGYAGKLYMDRDEFIEKFKNEKKFLEYFKEWQENNFDYALTPSVDRIDVKGNYTLDNVQIIPHGMNASKDKKIPVIVHDRNGNFIGEFDSATDFANEYNVQQANVWKVITGKRKHTCGFVIKYK